MRFLKKLLIVFLINLLSLSFAGCQVELKIPPDLKVLYQDKSIDAKMSSYSWTVSNFVGSKTAANGNGIIPAELAKSSTPLNVPSKSKLTLNFSSKPEAIEVNIWDNKKVIKQEITAYSIVTPESKGPVIYEVIGTWKQGKASYAFLIDVE